MFKLDAPLLCKNGHEQTPENVGVTTRGYAHCLLCKRETDREYRRARKEREAFKEMLAPRSPFKGPISPHLAAWVARKRRERGGLELRLCDREQVTEQMEDL